MRKYRVFVSYTMRDGEITIALLSKLKFFICSSSFYDAYVDIIDNHAADHQAYVINQLNEADAVLLIKTSAINASDWVKTELKIASDRNIPIIETDLKRIHSFIESVEPGEFDASCLFEPLEEDTSDL